MAFTNLLIFFLRFKSSEGATGGQQLPLPQVTVAPATQAVDQTSVASHLFTLDIEVLNSDIRVRNFDVRVQNFDIRL